MPAVIPFIPLITAGATAATSLVGAKMQSGAANKAANLTTQSANYAADRQAESSRNTETFLRQQAQAKWQADEADRKANYDQWAARERRLGSVGSMLGLGPRDIPAYVPSPDPRLGPQPQMSPGAVLSGPRNDMTGRPMPPPSPRTAGNYLAQRRPY